MISSPGFVLQTHPTMLLQALEPVLEVCFQLVQSSLCPGLPWLDTAHNRELKIVHQVVHFSTLAQVKPHSYSMVMKMGSKPITSPFNLTTVAIVPLPHLVTSLTNILALADKAGSQVHQVGVNAGVVPSDLVLSPRLSDLNSC